MLAAKRRGLIPAAGPILEELRTAGLFLGSDLMREALALVGETE